MKYFSIIFYLLMQHNAYANCYFQNCALNVDEAYPNLVLGKVHAIPDQKSQKEFFELVKGKGHWGTVSDDYRVFLKYVKIVEIKTISKGSEHIVTVLMAKNEFDAMPLQIGDFVRYTPHRSATPYGLGVQDAQSADAIAYWKLHGCVMALCRSGDSECDQKYRPGTYRKADGVETALYPNEAGIIQPVRIDVTTYLPVYH